MPSGEGSVADRPFPWAERERTLQKAAADASTERANAREPLPMRRSEFLTPIFGTTYLVDLPTKVDSTPRRDDRHGKTALAPREGGRTAANARERHHRGVARNAGSRRLGGLHREQHALAAAHPGRP